MCCSKEAAPGGTRKLVGLLGIRAFCPLYPRRRNEVTAIYGSNGHDIDGLYYASDRSAPPPYPHTPEQAQRSLARTLSWDNGSYHVWSISLAPWLDAHRPKQS